MIRGTCPKNKGAVVVAGANPKEGTLLSRHLRGEGLKVFRADNWRTGLASLKKNPSLVLLDLSLKRAERILRHAKRKMGNGQSNDIDGTHGIPVIAFDPQRNLLREVKAFRLGADGYIGRPAIKEEVLAAIKPWLEQRDSMEKFQKNLEAEERKRKSLEEELVKLKDFTEKISQHMPLSILIVDGDKKLVYVNAHFCAITGNSPAFLLKRPITEIFAPTLYGPIDLVQKIESVLEGNKATPRLSMQYRGNNYVYRVLPVSFGHKRGEAKIGRHAMILFENVSELQRLGEEVSLSEESYRSLFEDSPDAILVSRHGGGQILEINRQAVKMLGRNKTKLKKRSFVTLLSHEQKRRVKRVLMENRFTEGAFSLPDLAISLAKEKKLILAGSARPIYHRGQEALLFIFKDMTERKFLEGKVRESEKMATLGQFSAGTAHEINNPLAIISSNAQYLHSILAEQKVGKKEIGEILDTLNSIDREARYCGGIIKNLLAYTHVEKVTKESLDVGKVIEECLRIVERQFKLSNIEIDIKKPPELPKILGNANLLKQVFMNLTWNAQASMPKKGKLKIEMSPSKSGKTIEVSFEDTGAGISKENLKKLFTPFFTTKDVGKGTGLGLWVVRSILEEHKATIDVRSRMGKGTCFKIQFPVLSCPSQSDRLMPK